MHAGIKTMLSRLVPTADHVKTAQAAGHDVDTELRTLIRQIEDCHQIAKKMLADLARSNPRDPNCETLADVLRMLS